MFHESIVQISSRITLEVCTAKNYSHLHPLHRITCVEDSESLNEPKIIDFSEVVHHELFHQHHDAVFIKTHQLKLLSMSYHYVLGTAVGSTSSCDIYPLNQWSSLHIPYHQLHHTIRESSLKIYTYCTLRECVNMARVMMEATSLAPKHVARLIGFAYFPSTPQKHSLCAINSILFKLSNSQTRFWSQRDLLQNRWCLIMENHSQTHVSVKEFITNYKITPADKYVSLQRILYSSLKVFHLLTRHNIYVDLNNDNIIQVHCETGEVCFMELTRYISCKEYQFIQAYTDRDICWYIKRDLDIPGSSSEPYNLQRKLQCLIPHHPRKRT